MDWGTGNYEGVAAQLLPAAEALVEVASPGQSDRVLDLGCGTGNAAFLAARRGAQVTGVDPAPRLLEVAAAKARAEDLDIAFLEGEAASIPLEDGSADLTISVFGVIFAPDAGAAVAEIDRVTASGGRIAITAWIPKGAVAEIARIGREAVAAALGAPPQPPPTAWHEIGTLTDLLAPHGFAVTLEERELAFSADSAPDWVEQELRDHPVQVAAAQVLERAGRAEAVREQVIDVLEAANEDPSAFRITSRYVIATARRR